MAPALRIALKDLRLRVRDRSAFILSIGAPLILAVIFNFVFGGGLSGELDLQYGLVDQDGSDISHSFAGILTELEDDGLLFVTTYDDQAAADAAVDNGDIGAYFLLTPGLGDSIVATQPAEIQVIGDVDAPTSTQIAASIAEQFGAGVAGAQLAVGTAITLSPGNPDAASWGQEAAARPPSFVLTDISADTRQLDPTTYFAAGMAVFFLFFTVQFGVLGLLEEQRDGTMSRLLAAPIGRASIVLGKGILSFLLGLISVAVLAVATTILMGADWGPPLGVLLLVICCVLAAIAVMGLVASVAKTPEGAGNLGAIIAVILGMLGGTFFPIGQGNDILSRLTYLTPHAWFMRGLADISGGAPWTDAFPAAAALTLFALVLGAIAWVALRRKVTR